MERTDLLKLRNNLSNTELGNILMRMIQDYITKEGCKPNKSGECLKGMCEIAQLIKDIPNKCK